MSNVSGHGRIRAARRVGVVLATTALAGSTWVGVANATDDYSYGSDDSYGSSCVTYNYYFDSGTSTTPEGTEATPEEEASDPFADGAEAVGDAAGDVADAVEDGIGAVTGEGGTDEGTETGGTDEGTETGGTDEGTESGGTETGGTETGGTETGGTETGGTDEGTETGGTDAVTDMLGTTGIALVTYSNDDTHEPKYKKRHYAPVNCYKDYQSYKAQPTQLVATQVDSVPRGGVATGDGSLAP